MFRDIPDNTDAFVLSQPFRGAKRVRKHFLHHQRRAFYREIRVLKAGQVHEVIDQALQPHCLHEHLAVIFRNHGRLADNAVAECLQRAAQYGDRGAQLMGHVGQKIPSHGFHPLQIADIVEDRHGATVAAVTGQRHPVCHQHQVGDRDGDLATHLIA
ncbi:hypothetical protein SDC9_184701 [bioreactor metagenome]|uniref:Uncharacterized protein n=1 Tax=bioreactor metagenome TaxID=1076179 RepID=A0A645HDS0_9ZZZZ